MPTELHATLGKNEARIALEPTDDGRYRVVIDGRERVVEARQVRPGLWSLLCGHESWLVDVEERKGGKLALSARGGEATAKLEDARRRRMAEAVVRGPAAGGEVVRAPITGRVVKVLAAAGAKVAAGDPVVVVEAMKMENEIRTVRGGVVKQVHVGAGQSVESQEPLVTLE